MACTGPPDTVSRQHGIYPLAQTRRSQASPDLGAEPDAQSLRYSLSSEALARTASQTCLNEPLYPDTKRRETSGVRAFYFMAEGAPKLADLPQMHEVSWSLRAVCVLYLPQVFQ